MGEAVSKSFCAINGVESRCAATTGCHCDFVFMGTRQITHSINIHA